LVVSVGIWCVERTLQIEDLYVKLALLNVGFDCNGWEPKDYLQTLFERYPFAKNDGERRALLSMFLKPSN